MKWIIPAILIFIVGGRYMLLNSTRGLRNKNPGNIRKTNIQWTGKVEGEDRDFETFSDYEYGIRAIGKLLASYDRQGINTVESIINRYAPPVENDTGSYIKSVVSDSGLPANQRVQPGDRPLVVAAIIRHENGLNPFSLDFIERSVALA